METLLMVRTGSQAHGLATPESDYDAQGVGIVKTAELLSINRGPWHEHAVRKQGQVDAIYWELEHFLQLAVKSNPTALETFLGPVLYSGSDGNALRELFPFVWDSDTAYRAFRGYAAQQRHRFIENHERRAAKYAAARLRVLYWGVELLSTGTFTEQVSDTEIGKTLVEWRAGIFTRDEVETTCAFWETQLTSAHNTSPKHEQDLRPVNTYLLEMRKKYW